MFYTGSNCMAKISLRAYGKETEGLIDRGQYDQALAHCRHILKYYPKHIDTYRLMAKAYLEAQRYGDASDVFQRVLSSIPDDFVSHLGMSIIREDEGNLDAAIWHMERAFEIQPANVAIQSEMRRLYGRRDGMEPPKVRLTRGALARMYYKGELYHQAINELRAALTADPARTDLQVLLAQSYLRAGQRVDAADTCSAILKKLPYCIEANRIMAEILASTDRVNDAPAYRQRAIAMNPYLGQVSPRAPSPELVPDEAVYLDKLELRVDTGGFGAPSQPQWAASLGVEIEPAAGKQENVPDWLSDLDGLTQAAAPGDETPRVSPFVSSSDNEAPELAPFLDKSAPPTPQPADELIPEWMKDAGWVPSDGTQKEAEMGYSLGDNQPGEEDGLAPAEIPGWLRAIAPKDAMQEEEEIEDIDQGLVEALDSAALPWLEETPPGPSDTITTWLGEKSESMPAEAEAKELPDWLVGGTAAAAGLAAAGIGSEEEPTAQETAPEMEAGALPDWLVEEPAEKAAPIESPEPAFLETPEIVPADIEPALAADLSVLAGEDLTGPGDKALPWEDLAAAEPLAADEIPDWLKELGPAGAELQAVSQAEIETPVEEVVAAPEIGEEAPESELPEWMAEIPTVPVIEAEAEQVPDWLAEAPSEPAVEGEAEQIPEWLAELKPEAAIPEALEETPVAGITAQEEEQAFAWLEGLAAKQGASEALFLGPEERMEEAPEWVQKEAESEAIPSLDEAGLGEAVVGAVGLGAAALGAAADEELPVEEELPEEELTVPEVAEPGEWQPESFELPQEAKVEGPEEVLPEQAVEAQLSPEEMLPEWLRETGTEEEVVAVPTPSAADDELPEWLRQMETGAEAPAEALAEQEWLSEDLQPVESHDLTWLEEPEEVTTSVEDWLQTRTPVEGAETEPVSAEAISGEEQVWLPAEPAEEAGPEIPAAEELPAWLAEAPSGEAVVEAELEQFTVPEEPAEEAAPEIPAAEELPAWLAGAPPEEAAVEAEIEPIAMPEEPEVPEALVEAEEFATPGEPVVMEWPTALEEPEVTESLAEIEELELPEEAAIMMGAAALEEITEEEEPAIPFETALQGEPAAEEVSLAAAGEPSFELPSWLEETALVEEAAETPGEFLKIEEPAVIEGDTKPSIFSVPHPALAEEGLETPAEVVEETVEAPAVETGGESETEAALPEEGIPIEAQEAAAVPVSEEDAAFAWLESLAVKQGATEALMYTPEERSEEPPEWVTEAAQAEGEAPAPVESAEPAEEELIAEAAVPEGEGEVTEAEAVEGSLPDWLLAAAAAEAIISGEGTEAEELPGEEIPKITEPAEALEAVEGAAAAEIEGAGEAPVPVGETEIDAAYAWLESLAVKQGAEEALLLTPEERTEEAPEWVKMEAEAEIEIPEIEEPVTADLEEALPTPETAEALPPVELPEELVEAELPVELEAELPEEAVGEPAGEEVPLAWMGAAAGLAAGLAAEPVEEEAEPEGAEPEEITLEEPIPLEELLPAAPAVEEQVPELPSWLADLVAEDTTPVTPEPWTPASAGMTGKLGPIEEVSEEAITMPETIRLNLNNASLIELERLPGVGFVRAQALLDYRSTHGPLDSLDELRDVEGFDEDVIETLGEYVEVVPTPVRLPEPTAIELPEPEVIELPAPAGEADPLLVEARSALGRADIQAAVQHYQALIAKNASLHEVVKDLHNALYTYPVDVNIWLALGDAQMHAGEIQEALDAYTKAEELLR